MKVVLAGAFGKLGTDILIELCKQGHEVVALDLVTKELEGYNYTAKKIDVTKPETLAGTMDGAETVISTVGLTGTSATITNYDIDLNGNINLLTEAKKAGVKRLEKRQNKNYGEDPEYQAYVTKTPIVFPLIPLKHLENVKWIV